MAGLSKHERRGACEDRDGTDRAHPLLRGWVQASRGSKEALPAAGRCRLPPSSSLPSQSRQREAGGRASAKPCEQPSPSRMAGGSTDTQQPAPEGTAEEQSRAPRCPQVDRAVPRDPTGQPLAARQGRRQQRSPRVTNPRARWQRSARPAPALRAALTQLQLPCHARPLGPEFVPLRLSSIKACSGLRSASYLPQRLGEEDGRTRIGQGRAGAHRGCGRCRGWKAPGDREGGSPLWEA